MATRPMLPWAQWQASSAPQPYDPFSQPAGAGQTGPQAQAKTAPQSPPQASGGSLSMPSAQTVAGQLNGHGWGLPGSASTGAPPMFPPADAAPQQGANPSLWGTLMNGLGLSGISAPTAATLPHMLQLLLGG